MFTLWLRLVLLTALLLLSTCVDERLTKNTRGVLYSRKKRSVLRLISWQLFRA